MPQIMMAFVFVALFSQDQLRPVIQEEVIPAVTPCFNEAGSGTANLTLTFDGTSKRLTVALKSLDGNVSDDIRSCVRETLATLVLPPIAEGGTADVAYPFSYAIDPPDNHDLNFFHQAQRFAGTRHWSEALVAAGNALKLTTLDGKHRRQMVRIAGIAACHLDAESLAAHYEAMATSQDEAAIHAACAR